MTPADFWNEMHNQNLTRVFKIGPGSPEDEKANQKENEKSNVGKPVPPPDKVIPECGDNKSSKLL